MEVLELKRFTIKRTLIGKGITIKFVNHKKETCTYEHDKVYKEFQHKFDLMDCFEKYGR